MLMRDTNAPPNASLNTWKGISASFALGAMSLPAKTYDWSAPGRSSRNTARRDAFETVPIFLVGMSPGFHDEKARSSFALSSGIVMSPTATIVPWFGLNHARWNATRSARVIAFTEVSLPLPVSGCPYEWFDPYRRTGRTRRPMVNGCAFSC